MKICHVSFGQINHRTAKEWLNTVPYFTRILASMAEKHQVYSIHYGQNDEAVLSEGVTYRFLKNSFQESLLLRHLASSVHSLDPDVIILHGLHSSFRIIAFARLMKSFRIFVQHHGEKVFGFPKSLLQKRIDKNVQGYLFSSREMGEDWVRAGLIQNSNKILEVLEVTSSFPVNRHQIRNEKLNFIWVGRLDANKDPMTLVEGFISFLKICPNANLYLIFKTKDFLTEVRTQVSGFQDNIHLVGGVPHTEMARWYAKCDFIISTSLFEAGGVSVLEGISCGCIPILSDIPSFRKISVEGNVGVLFPKRSACALTNALLEAAKLNIVEERMKMLDYFEGHLSSTAIANQIIEFIATGFQKERSFALR